MYHCGENPKQSGQSVTFNSSHKGHIPAKAAGAAIYVKKKKSKSHTKINGPSDKNYGTTTTTLLLKLCMLFSLLVYIVKSCT